MGREPEFEPSAQDQFVQRAPEHEPSAWSSHRRWLVLLSSSYFSFTNAVMIMDFATDYTLSEALLGGASQSDVALLYSLFLLCVMPTMFFAAYGVVHHNYTTMAIGQSLNVVGAWLRYAAVLNGSFPLAVVSTVCAGASHRWTLEPHRSTRLSLGEHTRTAPLYRQAPPPPSSSAPMLSSASGGSGRRSAHWPPPSPCRATTPAGRWAAPSAEPQAQPQP